MARFSRSQRNAYITAAFAAGQELASPAVGAAFIEADRHLPTVSTADGVMFLTGSNPDNWIDMVLLEEGTGGIDNSGYQLIPMVTGNGTQTVPGTPTGGCNPSATFDTVSEIHCGLLTTPVENMLQVEYGGMYTLAAQCLPEPASGQGNREIECDIALFDSAGVFKFFLTITASGNQEPSGKSDTINFFNATIESTTVFNTGDCLGMVIRKAAGEGNTTATIRKAALGLTLLGLEQG